MMTEEASISISLRSGISVPAVHSTLEGARLSAIFAHGLGSTNPLNRGYANDRWVQMAKNSAESAFYNTFVYTARGHGASRGWEDSAEYNPDQFTWKYLALDMLAAAEYLKIDRFVVGGSSMGSATSLYAAIESPEKILGLVLMRPPTAWQERAHRRKFLLASADRLQEKMESLPEEEITAQTRAVHYVLRGTAYSDLPPVDSPDYTKIAHIPTLILTIQGDPAHPVSTAETLHRLLPNSKLYIADTPEESAQVWPALIQSFLQTVASSRT